MNRTTQTAVNARVKRAFNRAMKEYNNGRGELEQVDLRTCKAYISKTKHWYILRSYGTFIAAINRQSGEIYDALRWVYGYTATSAQHIAKFIADYNGGNLNRYREV